MTMTDKKLIARAYRTLAQRIERKSYLAIIADWLRMVRGAWLELVVE